MNEEKSNERNAGTRTKEAEEPMPRRWLTKYGIEQSRREGSVLFPPELVMSGHRFTLEMDGMHVALATDLGIVHLILSRGSVASLLDWLREHEEWQGYDLDPEYDREVIDTDCRYCYHNLAHTREQHQQALDHVKEQREQLEKTRLHRLFESA